MSTDSSNALGALPEKELRKLGALQDALDAVMQAERFKHRGYVAVTSAGEAFAIAKLDLPYEVAWTTASPKQRPHEHQLWAPSWVLLLMRHGYGDELIRCLTDTEHRNLLVDAISAMNNLKQDR